MLTNNRKFFLVSQKHLPKSILFNTEKGVWFNSPKQKFLVPHFQMVSNKTRKFAFLKTLSLPFRKWGEWASYQHFCDIYVTPKGTYTIPTWIGDIQHSAYKLKHSLTHKHTYRADRTERTKMTLTIIEKHKNEWVDKS